MVRDMPMRANIEARMILLLISILRMENNINGKSVKRPSIFRMKRMR